MTPSPSHISHNNADAPSTHDAAHALAEADRLAATLQKDVYALRVAMLSLAAATILGVLLIGLVPSVGAILAGTAAIAAASVAVSMVGAKARARDRAFGRRYNLTIAVWALLFIATVAIGMTMLHLAPGFWIPAAIICAIPPVAFAITGTRTARR